MHHALRDPRRLRALAATGLLERPRSEGFERLARLVRAIFGVRTAVVALIDEERELHAGAAGVPQPWAARGELPVDCSLTRHVVTTCEAHVVADAAGSPALAGDRAVRELGVRSWAIFPLVDENGFVLGALGALDPEPREWSPRDLGILQDLARAAVSEIDLATATREQERRRGALEGLVRDRTASLELTTLQVRQSELDLRASHEHTISRLSRAIEARNRETGWHVERMSRYAALVANRVGCDAEQSDLIRIAAPLHDIGKIAVPDRVLLKPGPLTSEERTTMQTHAELGHRMLCGSGERMLEMAAEIALTHHERVDGAGYPRGLRGDELPIAGQIAAVADVFDALISDRVYRRAFSFDQALEVLALGRGTHFEPAVVDALLDASEEVRRIQRRFADLHRDEPELITA